MKFIVLSSALSVSASVSRARFLITIPTFQRIDYNLSQFIKPVTLT